MAVTTRRSADSTPAKATVAAEAARTLADAIFLAEAEAIQANPLRRPGATYRLQVHRGFTLDDVARIVDYLADLGVTDGYLSPFLSARPGSTHGYDVFDYRRINAEIGDRQAHERLLLKLKERGMGRVLDIVPNHMGVAGLNPYWVEVLEIGPQSPHARFFDIDWSPLGSEMGGRILLPILEDQYGRVIDSGKLVLKRDGGRFLLAYHDRELPIGPRSHATILEHRLDDLREMGEDEEDVQELRSVAASARSLPTARETDEASIERVLIEKEVMKRRLRRLVEESPRMGAFLDETLADFRGTPGKPSSFDALHALLEQQVYRLSYWRVASEEINYRRFFDINDLAGLRTEDPRVFEATHARIVRWVSEGGVTGLRIDHPDGLADPAGYFRRLQERLFLKACHARYAAETTQPADWPTVGRSIRDRYRRELERDPGSPLSRRFPIVVEKILTRDEAIPRDWPIDGTVGYEFLNAVNGLFIDPNASESIRATYHDFTGESVNPAAVLFDAKRLITRSALASERNMLADRLARIAASDRHSRDFTRAELGRALGAIMASFPVYRTYLQPSRPVSKRDRKVIQTAVTRARKRIPTIDASVFDFIRQVLLREHPDGLAAEAITGREAFVTRFQQTTGPVQAKGLEDTTFYRYVPLVSLNEVGGDPSRFGASPDAFHKANARRLAHWPDSFLATATHDTKRGEDARVRIDALSEVPEEWADALGRWSSLNKSLKRSTSRGPAPDSREEYLFYQALIGSWPFGVEAGGVTKDYVERLQAYMVKAAREAKVKTSWTDADPSRVEALAGFVAEVLAGPESGAFLDDFRAFERRIARVGVVESLSQTLLKLTSPGVPDIYQGCELWDLSLVDPDNRRPVDFEHRAALLDAIKRRLDRGESRAALAASLLASPEDGAIKLFVVWTALMHRREQPELYRQGRYVPLAVEGTHADRVIAFARERDDRALITIAPRLVTALMGPDAGSTPIGAAWGSTAVVLPRDLAGDSWVNRLTDERQAVRRTADVRTLPLSEVFGVIPSGLLASSS